ncbi:hypothetical protein Q1695_011586 [Nippostrongylus brasiliensis]|nr:hypothetical protein Q1695_011586 [Nippostrongylus brasiliensis]
MVPRVSTPFLPLYFKVISYVCTTSPPGAENGCFALSPAQQVGDKADMITYHRFRWNGSKPHFHPLFVPRKVSAVVFITVPRFKGLNSI